jgi:pimeloyl-ACP methyl ester carboxylesterase
MEASIADEGAGPRPSKMPVEPFSLPFSQHAVDDLRDRLERTRWLDEIPDAVWEYGFDRSFLKDLCSYWKLQFDWKAELDKASALHHYRFTTGDAGVHFIHERGNGPSPMPILLTHGWPGSFLEMTKLIPLLSDPASHGGDATDAFDVVVPSMPGYGFSDRPVTRGVNTFRIAELWTQLMDELGYDRFAAQGGDFGAGVSTILGLRHSQRIIGIHLNYIPGSYRPYLAPGAKPSRTEQEFLRNAGDWYEQKGAYGHIQRTHPQTVAYGLNDSPAALAAWILEKFRDWSDCGGDLYSRFTRNELLANVTLYWMTETIHSSFRLYFETRKAPLEFAPGEAVDVPCAVAHFPKEAPFPPREWVERGYNVQRWTEMPRGGHFAAAEEPVLLAEDIRAFFRALRERQVQPRYRYRG